MSTEPETTVDFGIDPAYASQTAVVMTPDAAPETSMVIGSPKAVIDHASVTVYANSVNQISYQDVTSEIAAFDIIFSVGIASADGVCKTYQVVKRIGIDKARIAAEVENSAPMSIVEAKKEEQPKLKINESVSRARRLAGLE